MDTENKTSDVVIVGAGVAGLNCALELQKAGVEFTIFEADSRVGGRIQTDEVDGFKLDRGFQVFQTAYPEAQRVLDFEGLQLVELEPGARIRKSGRWHTMSDPQRRPLKAWATLTNRIGGWNDRWALLKLRSRLKKSSIEELLLAPEDTTTLYYLREQVGFSDDFIESFVRPWLAGIFLENDLETSSNYFKFVFKMLSEASVCLPKGGMGQIPKQMASRIEPAKIKLNSPVDRVGLESVRLKDGREVPAPVVVMAAGLPSDLLTDQELSSEDWNGTTCIYFSAKRPPSQEKSLMLNGEGQGAVNHVFLPSNSDPSLSPDDRALISVSLVGKHATGEPKVSAIQQELTKWYGQQVQEWQHLKTYHLPKAVPKQVPGNYHNVVRQPLPGRFLCGDVTESASLNGALQSGRETAQAVIDFLK